MERNCPGHCWVIPDPISTFYVPDWGNDTPDPRHPGVVCEHCGIEYDRLHGNTEKTPCLARIPHEGKSK